MTANQPRQTWECGKCGRRKTTPAVALLPGQTARMMSCAHCGLQKCHLREPGTSTRPHLDSLKWHRGRTAR